MIEIELSPLNNAAKMRHLIEQPQMSIVHALKLASLGINDSGIPRNPIRPPRKPVDGAI